MKLGVCLRISHCDTLSFSAVAKSNHTMALSAFPTAQTFDGGSGVSSKSSSRGIETEGIKLPERLKLPTPDKAERLMFGLHKLLVLFFAK